MRKKTPNPPKVFISYREKDDSLARHFNEFIVKESKNQLGTFYFGEAKSAVGRQGQKLTDALQECIESSAAFIFIYTGPDIDGWELCTWECAWARSQGLKVHVIQCGDSSPKAFVGDISFRLERESLKEFVLAVLSTKDFFHGQVEALFPNIDSDHVESITDALYENTSKAFKGLREEKEWIPWPLLTLAIEKKHFKSLEGGDMESSLERIDKILEQYAKVERVSENFAREIGVGISAGESFKKAREAWRTKYLTRERQIFQDLLCSQIYAAYSDQFIPLQLQYAIGTDGKIILPVVSRKRTIGNERIEFDIQFYDTKDDDEALTIYDEDRTLTIIVPNLENIKKQSLAALLKEDFDKGTLIVNTRSTSLSPIFGIGARGEDWLWDEFRKQMADDFFIDSGPDKNAMAEFFDELPKNFFISFKRRICQPIVSIFRDVNGSKRYQAVLERIAILGDKAEITLRFFVTTQQIQQDIVNPNLQKLFSQLEWASRFRWEVLERYSDEGAIEGDGASRKLLTLLKQITELDEIFIQKGFTDPDVLLPAFGKSGSKNRAAAERALKSWPATRSQLEEAVAGNSVLKVIKILSQRKAMNKSYLIAVLNVLKHEVQQSITAAE